MWAAMDNWTCPSCLIRMCGTETDIWICGPGMFSLGMFIFGDVYSYSTWIVHTHTHSLHTNDSINMDKNLDKFVCWSCCSVVLL